MREKSKPEMVEDSAGSTSPFLDILYFLPLHVTWLPITAYSQIGNASNSRIDQAMKKLVRDPHGRGCPAIEQ